MPTRHPIPRIWLMTDPRLSDGLWSALERMPRGSGVVFRHYALDRTERAALFAAVQRVARRRRLVLLRAGDAVGRGEDGVHGLVRRRRPGLHSRPAHSRREAIAAVRAGADLLFVSPVFATRSHPGARPLGQVRMRLLIRGLEVPVIALGGMSAARARQLCVHGWAAIDAWG